MIILKSPLEIDKMRKANKIVSEVLKKVSTIAVSGVRTKDLDKAAEEMILKKGGKPAFKGYRGFPGTLCVSVNDEVVHGIPSERKLKDGDLLSIDVGVLLNGYFGDAAISLGVGNVDKETQRLMDITKSALGAGINVAKSGNHVSDISQAVQQLVENNGYSVVRAFVGHGIGASLHEEPQIPNFGKSGEGPILKKGMVLAIEPMVNVGCSEVNVLKDKWTVVTADKELSAHFEHTIAITDEEPEILTQ